MSYQRKIYEKDDESWWLCSDQNNRVFILHEANGGSGGQTTRIEIGDFLRASHLGPEHRCLLRLIGGLAKMTAADLA
jgi:hypothetical protein